MRRFDGESMRDLRLRRAMLAAILRCSRAGFRARELVGLVEAGLFRVRRSAADRGRGAA